MAKIITKFRYSKPTADRKIGGYAGYIATREGVEKIDDSKKYAPVTKKQREIIRKNPYLHSVANEFIISCKNSLQGERI